jgi:8-oxo-dGTP pyrophosphatase MutT (NUDIX family)
MGERKVVCPDCGFTLYFNTAAAVAALIFDSEGRLMVVSRNREPQKGLLDLPGGFVDFGEDAENALKREVSEELGVDVEVCGYHKSMPNTYLYKGILYHTLDIFFTCRAANGDLPLQSVRRNDEIADIRYRHPAEIREEEIAFDSMKRVVRALKP